MKKNVTLSPQGLEKLKNELKELEEVRRPAVIKRIQAARALGDLSENSEYEDARNEQSFIEGRIEELKEMLKHANVVNKKNNSGSVGLGSVVSCEVDGDKEEYEIVSSVEADPDQGKISIESPLGRSLQGAKEGSVVKVKTPAGVLTYKVLAVK